MIKYLIMEDDCAPDAIESFDKVLIEQYGLTRKDFRDLGTQIESDELTTEWHLNGLILEISADDPFYKLRKKE